MSLSGLEQGHGNGFLNRWSYVQFVSGAPISQDVMSHDNTPRHVSVLEIVLT